MVLSATVVVPLLAGAAAATGISSQFSAFDTGTGGVFVAGALVVLLAYLDLLQSSPDADPRHHRAVVLAVVPLLLTFSGIVLYESLRIVDLI